MSMPILDKTMFREYDIRGRVDKELSDDAVFFVARGFATFLKRRSIDTCVVGYDGREYSPRLAEKTIEGLLQSGIHVIELGMVTTPILYFSQYHLKQKGAVMVTASHNPNGWSGLKQAYDYSTTLVPEDVEELYQIIIDEDFSDGAGTRKRYEQIVEVYQKDLLSRVHIDKKFKVVVDAGNGTAGPINVPILRAAGMEVIEQCCDLDFSFPNHEPNPSSLPAIEHLAARVKEASADIGFGFDGDGDRLGIVDDKGTIVWTDKVLILLARDILKNKPGAPIVFDVKCTQALLDDIIAHGGEAVMWKTGHSHIKKKGREVGAALAGERSGHVFFFDGYYGFDDGLFAGLKVLEYLSRDMRALSEILHTDVAQWFTSPVWQAPCDDNKKYSVVEKLTKQFKEEFGSDKVIDVNGARVYFEDGWGLVRASSNVPSLVLVFESRTEAGLKRIEQLFRERLSQFSEVGSEWESG
ncbi:MAG: Phosphomannomutase [Candidatus Magasanikbacteria bacterium GW2011_GWA2_46_17]|uniref:Phosphomannomutase n=1 Tax=Candidatus Magasanikbacteria bacterium GW2011_GWA2_46_17 TaxID=1619042 RepID=A0A0G1P3C0_9BACT|nr:MAG: Phosphomannomutase [Candidatus Magasanikbacteria bacterium GW2011_GWA2_46_17]